MYNEYILIIIFYLDPAGNIGAVKVPYVTAKQKLWAGVRSDVYGSTVDGAVVLPSNHPNEFQDPPVPAVSQTSDFVVIPANHNDPSQILYNNPCVYLQPGATYYWSNVQITRPVIIHGRGATIKLKGTGPIIEVSTGLNVAASNCPVTMYDIVFDGSAIVNRNTPMSQDFFNHSAIWFTNAWRSSLINCTFINFNGSALWYRDDSVYTTLSQWAQQHSVIGCKFNLCRIGISNSGRSEYSVANSNLFVDCGVCFNVIGGNWRRTGNNIVTSKCAYLHVESGMWYEGSNKQNTAHGAFTSNTLNHCDNGSKWPAAWTLADGRQIPRISGMYFDSSVSCPPTFTGNALWYTSLELRGFALVGNMQCFCLTGCTFMGNPNNNTQSRVAIASSRTNEVYFIGCTGNNIAVYNAAAANFSPKFGDQKTGNYDTEYPLRGRSNYLPSPLNGSIVIGNVETNEIMELESDDDQ